MHGTEWIVDAQGCCAEPLRDLEVLRKLFREIIAGLNLRTVGDTLWYQFPGTGGITGLCLLSESHLTCHTFPEFGSLCLNLFCCTPRSQWDFESQLPKLFSASSVQVRVISREYSALTELDLVGEAREER